jgi:anti-sigma regulatory factor (Ser/Thr protein kinase)
VPRSARLELEGAPHDPFEARRFAQQRLAEWDVGTTTCDVALLLVSELVTNAIKYAPGPIVVELEVAGEFLRVAVQDRAAHAVPAPVPIVETTAESGRGLALVSQLSRRWGSGLVDDGKVVWFELATA